MNMAVHTLNPQSLDDTIQKHEIIFIDFWAQWCAPCKHFAEVYERVSESFPEIAFLKVNVEEEPEFAESFQIRSIPHLLVIKQGVVIYSDSGSMPESTLVELIEQAKTVSVE